MNELEKIKTLRKQLIDEQDKITVDKAAAALSKTFQTMIFRTQDALLGKDDQRETSFDEVRTALETLRSYGARCNIAFPDIETDEEIAAYILQFGRDVLFSDRNR